MDLESAGQAPLSPAVLPLDGRGFTTDSLCHLAHRSSGQRQGDSDPTANGPCPHACTPFVTTFPKGLGGGQRLPIFQSRVVLLYTDHVSSPSYRPSLTHSVPQPQPHALDRASHSDSFGCCVLIGTPPTIHDLVRVCDCRGKVWSRERARAVHAERTPQQSKPHFATRHARVRICGFCSSVHRL